MNLRGLAVPGTFGPGQPSGLLVPGKGMQPGNLAPPLGLGKGAGLAAPVPLKVAPLTPLAPLAPVGNFRASSPLLASRPLAPANPARGAHIVPRPGAPGQPLNFLPSSAHRLPRPMSPPPAPQGSPVKYYPGHSEPPNGDDENCVSRHGESRERSSSPYVRITLPDTSPPKQGSHSPQRPPSAHRTASPSGSPERRANYSPQRPPSAHRTASPSGSPERRAKSGSPRRPIAPPPSADKSVVPGSPIIVPVGGVTSSPLHPPHPSGYDETLGPEKMISPRAVYTAVTDIAISALKKRLGTQSLAQLGETSRKEEGRAQDIRAVAEELYEDARELRRALVEARLREADVIDGELRLRTQVSEAYADVRVLMADLPPLLQARRSELRGKLASVAMLTETSEHGCLLEEQLQKQRQSLSSEAFEASRVAKERRERSLALPGQCRTADLDVEVLLGRCLQADEQSETLRARIQTDTFRRQQYELEHDDLKRDLDNIQNALALTRRRHEEAANDCWERTESYCMARRLEVEEQRRSIELSRSQFDGKTREARFWQDRAHILASENQSARADREREVADIRHARGAPHGLVDQQRAAQQLASPGDDSRSFQNHSFPQRAQSFPALPGGLPIDRIALDQRRGYPNGLPPTRPQGDYASGIDGGEWHPHNGAESWGDHQIHNEQHFRQMSHQVPSHMHTPMLGKGGEVGMPPLAIPPFGQGGGFPTGDSFDNFFASTPPRLAGGKGGYTTPGGGGGSGPGTEQGPPFIPQRYP